MSALTRRICKCCWASCDIYIYIYIVKCCMWGMGMFTIFVVEKMDMILHGIMQSTLEHCVEKL